MLTFQKVTFRNFLSTGNQPTEIYLNRVPSVLITGQNGAGKSTILDAITYGLFGKAYRNISKPQLVNTVNEKALVVELHFSINEVPYKVVRGMKPNVFEIYRDDVLLAHDAAAKDYQKRLEEIVGMNYKAFTQIVILGSARYQSFMDLSTGDRRVIIEEILDITVFSKMNAVLKTRSQDTDLEIRDNDYQKDIVSTKLSGQKGLIKSIKNRQKESDEQITEQKKKIQGEIKLLDYTIQSLDSDISQIQTHQLEELQARLRDIQSKAKEVAKKGKEHDKRISFYQTTDVCHSCEQDLSEELKFKQIEKYTSEKQKLIDLAPTISTAMQKAEASVAEATEIDAKLQSKTDEKRSNIATKKALEASLQSLSHQAPKVSSEAELATAERDLEKLEIDRNTLEKEAIALKEERHHLDICKVLLKDDGIKAKIIKQYLPVMNNLINKFLDRMGANYSFHLDESFNEVIKSRYRDSFSYASFSEGEKMKIDIALMLTWREIAKIKNSVNTNLLIMDEVGDSSLDGESTDALWDIMSEMADTNIFVISHRTSNIEKFTSHVQVIKEGNFSKIVDSKSSIS